MLPDHDASRAVLIGAHSYSHLGDLRGVEGNVRDLKRFLTSPGGWRLPEQHCLDRLQPAGRDELLEELYRAAEEAEDTLLIYYAGHGLNDPASAEKLHLAMPASHPDRPFTWISYDDIRQAVFQSRAVRKLVVLDCCYGGRAIAGGMSGTSGTRQAPAAPLDTVAEAGMTEREGVAVLTAASEEEQAWCPPRGDYSAFTGPLLQLLHHGITGPFPGQANGTPRGEHREWIDLGTAHAYLQAQLRGKRTDDGRPLAEPQLGSRNSGWGIVLARNVAYTGAAPSPDPGSPGPTLPRLITLKSPRTDFVGRQAWLDEIVSLGKETAQAGGGPAVVIVHGMGGAGKTEIIRQAADRLTDHFDAAHFEIALDGYTKDRDPQDPDLIITEHLQRIGYQPQEIPKSPNARETEWKSWLSGKRALLLLDNAREAEQIMPLLPGPTSPSLVLITSRDRLNGVNAHRYFPTAGLDRTESVELLREVGAGTAAEGTPEELAEIAMLCCDTPVALRSVGTLLQDMPAASLLKDMRQGHPLQYIPDGYKAVQMAFTTSYKVLSKALQRLLRHCSWHPGPDFGEDSITALTDRPGAATGLALLLQRNLLLSDGGRFSFHDLFREHAQDVAAAEAATLRPDSRSRLYDYLSNRLTAAQIAVYGIDYDGAEHPEVTAFPDPGAAQSWLGIRSAELEAATLAAYQDQWPGALALGKRVARWLRFNDQHGQARELLDFMLSFATAAGDRRGQANALTGTADTHRMQDEHGPALEAYRQALDLYRAIGDRRGQANALTGTADTHRMQDEHGPALEAYRQALDLYRAIGDRRGQANALTGTADTHRMQDEHGPALEAYRQALDLYRAIGDRRGQANALTGTADTHRMQDEHGPALEAYRQALDLYRAIGDRRGQANALTGTADTHRMQDEHGPALEAYRQALDLYRAIGDRRGQANALTGTADTHRMQDEHGPALEAYRQALDLYRAIGDRRGQANALWGVAHLRRARGEYSEARRCFQGALELYRLIGNTTWADNCREQLRDLGDDDPN
ncbi:caspase, EACC1-associated type [Streptomyces sp. NBC_00887]|uniref:caspase, EACC1-associated type n=1 Tax=Streptomyces sp. NBC_00887 TaxID=2975859 RepID=UPI002F9091F3|nr:tetratricopeptide repeat protein [Streptomyces sp. NBC_00887]